MLHWPRVGTAGSFGCPNMLVVCDLDIGAFRIRLLLVDVSIKFSYCIIFCSRTSCYVGNSYKDVKVCGSSSDILKAQKEHDA